MIKGILGLISAAILVGAGAVAAWAYKSGALKFVPLNVLIPAAIVAFVLVVICAKVAKYLILVGAVIGAIGAVLIVRDASGRAANQAQALCERAAAELHVDGRGCAKVQALPCLRFGSDEALACVKERLAPPGHPKTAPARSAP